MRMLGYVPPSADRRIYRALGDGAETASSIAKKTGLPRTSVRFRMEKMRTAGFLSTRRAGKKVLYSIKEFAASPVPEGSCYTRENFLSLYEPLLTLPPDSTLYGIQGAKAARFELDEVPHEFIRKIHRYYKRNRITLKGISNVALLNVFGKIEPSLIESHVGRTLGIKLFKNDLFLGPGEVFIARNVLIAANPQQLTGTVVTDAGVCELLFELTGLFFDSLDHMSSLDLNEWLRSILAESADKR